MNIEEQLKTKILKRYKSIRAFTIAIDVPYTTLDSVFKRGINNAGVATMLKVFKALGLDIESISDGILREHSVTNEKSPTVSDETESDPRFKVLKKNYSQMSENGKIALVQQSEIMVLSGLYDEHSKIPDIKQA